MYKRMNTLTFTCMTALHMYKRMNTLILTCMHVLHMHTCTHPYIHTYLVADL